MWHPPPSSNKDLTALCGCQPLLSFKWTRTCFLLRVKTADVTVRRGRSGSSSRRALDRPAEPHDGWALSISRRHLWPEPGSSWRLPLHAPLTSLTESAARIKPSQHRGENNGWSWKESRGNTRCGGAFFRLPNLRLYLICERSSDGVKRWQSVSLACYSLACVITISLTFNTYFVWTSNKAFEAELMILEMRSDANNFLLNVSGGGKNWEAFYTTTTKSKKWNSL